MKNEVKIYEIDMKIASLKKIGNRWVTSEEWAIAVSEDWYELKHRAGIYSTKHNLKKLLKKGITPKSTYITVIAENLPALRFNRAEEVDMKKIDDVMYFRHAEYK